MNGAELAQGHVTGQRQDQKHRSELSPDEPMTSHQIMLSRGSVCVYLSVQSY